MESSEIGSSEESGSSGEDLSDYTNASSETEHNTDDVTETEEDSDFIPPSKKKRKVILNDDTEDSTLNPDETLNEIDYELCSICLSCCTNAGEHRLSSLDCGHYFGHKCITDWFKSKRAKNVPCPQCNHKCKLSSLRVIYANRLVVVDTAEKDRIEEDYNKERSRRREAEIEAAEFKLRLHLAIEERKKIESRVKLLTDRLDNVSTVVEKEKIFVKRGEYSHLSSLTSSEVLDMRHLVYCSALESLISTQESKTIFKGFGLRSMFLQTCQMKFVPLHKELINCISLNTLQGDPFIMTASKDKTVKIMDLSQYKVTTTINCSTAVQSCVWASENSIYLAMGMGNICLYDIRQSNAPVDTVQLGSPRPVVSLKYLPPCEEHSDFPVGGLFAGQHDRCTFLFCDYNGSDNETLKADHSLHAITSQPNMVWLNAEKSTRYLLTTHRPTTTADGSSTVKYALHKIMSAFVPDSARHTISNSVVEEFHGGSSMVRVSQSALYTHPDSPSDLMIAAGDEKSSSVNIWDVSLSGKMTLSPDLVTPKDPVTCVVPFESNKKLAILSNKALSFYQWNPAAQSLDR